MLLINLKYITLFVTIFAILFVRANAYKFLAVLPTTAPSHFIVSSALMKGLAQQGHEVTVISPILLKKPIKNYHEIETPGVYDVTEPMSNFFLKTVNRSLVENLVDFFDMGINATEAILKEPGVVQLMRSQQKFDAVICEISLSEALFGLSEHFNAPLIGFGTFGATAWNTDMVGSPSPPSYVPSPLLHFTDHMTLPQRIGNLAFLTFERIFLDYFYLPRQEALYRKYFPHNKRSFAEVRKNTAIVLLNQHVSLSFPRPYMPNQIEVGGLHINRTRTPLPSDMQKFLDDATDGAIYFSMGSNLKSKDLPMEKRQAILNTFRNMKQRVLWKFEDTNLVDKPANVYINAWFPQDDILAHPNVRAFITHGGLLSTTESIYHGKPIVGIPILGDQFINMARAEQIGYGIMLDFNKLNEATLSAAIQRVLSEPMYGEKVRDLSARFRDQPLEPLDLAVYWVEHVARHNGAQYLHCAGLDLNFWQYHNIDAILILFGGLFAVVLLVVLLIRFLLCKLISLVLRKKNNTKKQKQQ